jgi:hypothetical protein
MAFLTVKDALGERLGVPFSLTVATKDSIACLMIASMSPVISNIVILSFQSRGGILIPL